MIQILCKQIERGNHKKMSFTLVATNSMLATGTIQFQNNITAVLKTYSSLKLRSNSHTQIINHAKLCCFVFTHIGKVVKKTNFCSWSRIFTAVRTILHFTILTTYKYGIFLCLREPGCCCWHQSWYLSHILHKHIF